MKYRKGEKFHRGRDHPVLKAMALFVAMTFAQSTVIWAVPPISAPVEPNREPVPSVSQVHIPEEVGVVEEVYQSPNSNDNSPLVIYIQDAHCIYEAQSNIRKIIDTIQKNNALKLIALEGGEGKANPALFRAFPVQEVKEKIIDGYVRRGELSGAEFAAIANERESDFYGIEDMKIYFENKKAFLKAIDEKKRIDMKLDDIDRWLRKIMDETYSPELKELFQKTEDYEKEHLNLLDYVKYLKSFDGIVGNYPMIDALLAAVEREKAIDFKKIDEEAMTLSRELERTLKATNGDELKEFRDKDAAFKRGEIKRESYYLWLLGKAKDVGVVTDDEKNAELNGYMHHVVEMEKIKGEELFKEIDALAASIKEKLFQSDRQRQLDQLFHRLKILRNLSKLELSRDELAEYHEHQADFSEKNFWDFIGREMGQMELDDLFRPHRAFYDVALERDETLHKNLMKLLNSENRKFAMVITGGFHTNGIKEMLKRDGISYMLIIPRITQFDEKTPYWDVMRGKVSYAKWLKKETLSPELFLVEYQKAADQGLSTEFAQGVKENLPQILQGWKNAINARADLSPEQKSEYAAVIDGIFNKLIRGKEAIPAAADIAKQLSGILKSFFDGKRDEALKKIDTLEKQIHQAVPSKQEMAAVGLPAIETFAGKPAEGIVTGRSLGSATAEELDLQINTLKESKGLDSIRQFSEGNTGLASFLKQSGMDATRVNIDLFLQRLNRILEEAAPTKLGDYVSNTEALTQLISDLSTDNFSDRKADIQKQLDFLKFYSLTVKRDYTDGDTVSQAVFEKAINYLMAPEKPASIDLAMITLPIASANKIGGVEMGNVLKNKMMNLIKKYTGPDNVRALPLQDVAGTSQGYIGTRLIALGLSKEDLGKILTEGFADVKEKLKTQFNLTKAQAAELEKTFNAYGATSVIHGPSMDEKRAFKNETNPEVRNKLGKQMVESLEGEVVRQLKTATARAEVQEKILKQQGIFDEAQLDKPPPGLVQALKEAEVKYIPQNDYFTGRLPRPGHDLGRIKIAFDGRGEVQNRRWEQMGLAEKLTAIANGIDNYNQVPTPEKHRALQSLIDSFKNDYAGFQSIFDHTVLRSLQDIRYSRSYKLSSFGKLIQAEEDGGLDRLTARMKLDPNSFTKGIYMTKLGDEIGLVYRVNGKLTMSFLEFNKFNAFNDQFPPDAKDSFYHNILQSLYALALEHGADKGLTAEQNAEFLKAAEAAILNTQVEFTDEAYAGGFPLRAKDGSPIIATVERVNPETGKTELVKTDIIQQGDKAKIKDIPFHFTEKISGKRMPLYEDSNTGEIFAVMNKNNPKEIVFDAKGKEVGVLKNLGLNLTPVVGVTGATATTDTRRGLFDENGILQDLKKHFEWLGDMNGKQKKIPELKGAVAEAQDIQAVSAAGKALPFIFKQSDRVFYEEGFSKIAAMIEAVDQNEALKYLRGMMRREGTAGLISKFGLEDYFRGKGLAISDIKSEQMLDAILEKGITMMSAQVDLGFEGNENAFLDFLKRIENGETSLLTGAQGLTAVRQSIPQNVIQKLRPGVGRTFFVRTNGKLQAISLNGNEVTQLVQETVSRQVLANALKGPIGKLRARFLDLEMQAKKLPETERGAITEEMKSMSALLDDIERFKVSGIVRKGFVKVDANGRVRPMSTEQITQAAKNRLTEMVLKAAARAFRFDAAKMNAVLVNVVTAKALDQYTNRLSPASLNQVRDARRLEQVRQALETASRQIVSLNAQNVDIENVPAESMPAELKGSGYKFNVTLPGETEPRTVFVDEIGSKAVIPAGLPVEATVAAKPAEMAVTGASLGAESVEKAVKDLSLKSAEALKLNTPRNVQNLAAIIQSKGNSKPALIEYWNQNVRGIIVGRNISPEQGAALTELEQNLNFVAAHQGKSVSEFLRGAGVPTATIDALAKQSSMGEMGAAISTLESVKLGVSQIAAFFAAMNSPLTFDQNHKLYEKLTPSEFAVIIKNLNKAYILKENVERMVNAYQRNPSADINLYVALGFRGNVEMITALTVAKTSILDGELFDRGQMFSVMDAIKPFLPQKAGAEMLPATPAEGAQVQSELDRSVNRVMNEALRELSKGPGRADVAAVNRAIDSIAREYQAKTNRESGRLQLVKRLTALYNTITSRQIYPAITQYVENVQGQLDPYFARAGIKSFMPELETVLFNASFTAAVQSLQKGTAINNFGLDEANSYLEAAEKLVPGSPQVLFMKQLIVTVKNFQNAASPNTKKLVDIANYLKEGEANYRDIAGQLRNSPELVQLDSKIRSLRDSTQKKFGDIPMHSPNPSLTSAGQIMEQIQKEAAKRGFNSTDLNNYIRVTRQNLNGEAILETPAERAEKYRNYRAVEQQIVAPAILPEYLTNPKMFPEAEALLNQVVGRLKALESQRARGIEPGMGPARGLPDNGSVSGASLGEVEKIIADVYYADIRLQDLLAFFNYPHVEDFEKLVRLTIDASDVSAAVKQQPFIGYYLRTYDNFNRPLNVPENTKDAEYVASAIKKIKSEIQKAQQPSTAQPKALTENDQKIINAVQIITSGNVMTADINAAETQLKGLNPSDPYVEFVQMIIDTVRDVKNASQLQNYDDKNAAFNRAQYNVSLLYQQINQNKDPNINLNNPQTQKIYQDVYFALQEAARQLVPNEQKILRGESGVFDVSSPIQIQLGNIPNAVFTIVNTPNGLFLDFPDGKTLPLFRGREVSIGRELRSVNRSLSIDGNNLLQLGISPDQLKQISRVHVKIQIVNDKVQITDSSSNGTLVTPLVAGTPVRAASLGAVDLELAKIFEGTAQPVIEISKGITLKRRTWVSAGVIQVVLGVFKAGNEQPAAEYNLLVPSEKKELVKLIAGIDQPNGVGKPLVAAARKSLAVSAMLGVDLKFLLSAEKKIFDFLDYDLFIFKQIILALTHPIRFISWQFVRLYAQIFGPRLAKPGTVIQHPVEGDLLNGKIKRAVFVFGEFALGDEILAMSMIQNLQRFIESNNIPTSIEIVTNQPFLYEGITKSNAFKIHPLSQTVIKQITEPKDQNGKELLDLSDFDLVTSASPKLTQGLQNQPLALLKIPRLIDFNTGKYLEFYRNGSFQGDIGNKADLPENIALRWQKVTESIFGNINIHSTTINFTPEELGQAKTFLDQKFERSGNKIIIVNPIAGPLGFRQEWRKMKNWAPENYVNLIRQLRKEYPDHNILVGTSVKQGDSDAVNLVQEITRSANDPQVKSLFDETSGSKGFTVRQFASIVKDPRIHLSIGGDTGTNQHLMSALGVKSLALFNKDLSTANFPKEEDSSYARTSKPFFWGSPSPTSFVVRKNFKEGADLLTVSDVADKVDLILHLEENDWRHFFPEQNLPQAAATIQRLQALLQRYHQLSLNPEMNKQEISTTLPELRDDVNKLKGYFKADAQVAYLFDLTFLNDDNPLFERDFLPADYWFNSNLYKFVMNLDPNKIPPVRAASLGAVENAMDFALGKEFAPTRAADLTNLLATLSPAARNQFFFDLRTKVNDYFNNLPVDQIAAKLAAMPGGYKTDADFLAALRDANVPEELMPAGDQLAKMREQMNAILATVKTGGAVVAAVKAKEFDFGAALYEQAPDPDVLKAAVEQLAGNYQKILANYQGKLLPSAVMQEDGDTFKAAAVDMTHFAEMLQNLGPQGKLVLHFNAKDTDAINKFFSQLASEHQELMSKIKKQAYPEKLPQSDIDRPAKQAERAGKGAGVFVGPSNVGVLKQAVAENKIMGDVAAIQRFQSMINLLNDFAVTLAKLPKDNEALRNQLLSDFAGLGIEQTPEGLIIVNLEKLVARITSEYKAIEAAKKAA